MCSKNVISPLVAYTESIIFFIQQTFLLGLEEHNLVSICLKLRVLAGESEMQTIYKSGEEEGL